MAAADEILRHFEADEAAADHDSGLGARIYDRFDAVHVGQVAQREDGGMISAGQWGADWSGAGREQ
jgi:hypothetical protein